MPKKFILFCASLIWLFSLSFAWAQDVYIHGFDPGMRPFAYLDEKGQPAGFDIDCLQWLAEEKGFEVIHKAMPLNELIPALLDEKIDLIWSAYSITVARMMQVQFSSPYWLLNKGLVAAPGSAITLDQVLFGRVSIGTVEGTASSAWISEHLIRTGYMPPDQLKEYASYEMLMAAVLANDVQTAMTDEHIALHYAQSDGLTFLGHIATGERYGVAMRKEDKDLLKLINSGLSQLRASAQWSQFIQKYSLPDPAAPPSPESK